MNNILGIIISYVFVAIIIIIANLFEKLGKEASRKFIHIMLAYWWIIAMLFFKDVIWACFVPFTFIVINYISYKKSIISVMERDKQDGLGTVYYAIALFLNVIFTFGILNRPEIGLCSIFIMGYGDGFASVVGQYVKSYEYKIGDTTKTIAGSITMFIISFAILVIFLINIGSQLWLLKSIIIALAVTLVEAISIKGTDNLTVPAVASILLAIL